MKVVAILDRSAGNETVGDMWKETAIFDESTPVVKILEWAERQWSNSLEGRPENFRGNLRIAIGQEATHDHT